MINTTFTPSTILSPFVFVVVVAAITLVIITLVTSVTAWLYFS